MLGCTFRYRTAAHLHLMEAAAAQLDVSRMRNGFEHPMNANSEAPGTGAIRRWGGMFATVLFAASLVVHIRDGSSVGHLMSAAGMTVVFGALTWQQWRRPS